MNEIAEILRQWRRGCWTGAQASGRIDDIASKPAPPAVSDEEARLPMTREQAKATCALWGALSEILEDTDSEVDQALRDAAFEATRQAMECGLDNLIQGREVL